MWQINSNLNDVDWPALPSLYSAQILAVLFQCEQSQWCSPDAIQRRQFEQAAQLLNHAVSTSRFYRERLGSLGIDGTQPMTMDRWLQVPILHRRDVQCAGESLRSSAPPPEHGPTRLVRTSGSSGRPVSVLKTRLSDFFWQVLTLRDHQWHRRDLMQTLAVIRDTAEPAEPTPSGLRFHNWGPATRHLQTGPCHLLDIDTPIASQARLLSEWRPGYILTYPTNAGALARHFLGRREGLPGLREIRTFGEVLDPDVRDICRKAWGVDVTDCYSAQEVGYLALRCPQEETYHVQAENVLVEVLDRDGRPCRPGEIGRVVATGLHDFATPLIRYEIGDYARVGDRCPCGRGLPVLDQIMGRQRNMLRLPDGTQYWPVTGRLALRQKHIPDMPPVEQYQYVQKSLTQIELKLVTPERLTSDQERRMQDYIAEMFHYPFDLTVRYVDEISCGPTGKYEDFLSEVSGDDAP